VNLLGQRPSLQVCTALAGAALLIGGCTADSTTVTTSTVTVTKDPSAAAPSGAPAPAETTRDFPVEDFTAVHLDAHYDLVVNVGTPTSVRAQGDPAALDLLDIRTEGDTLVAGAKPNVQWPPNSRVTVTVTTPALTAAELSGSGEIRIGVVRADTLSIRLDGSGEIEAPQIAVTRLELSSEGSGDIRAGGTADDAVITLDGSGETELEALSVKRAQVSVSGSGDLVVQASETVSGTTSGSGDVEVTGGADCSISSTGSGEASCA
jgi:hypothetical protein